MVISWRRFTGPPVPSQTRCFAWSPGRSGDRAPRNSTKAKEIRGSDADEIHTLVPLVANRSRRTQQQNVDEHKTPHDVTHLGAHHLRRLMRTTP